MKCWRCLTCERGPATKLLVQQGALDRVGIQVQQPAAAGSIQPVSFSTTRAKG